nr:MAG TPA: hypothetical protein [Caudoviricetes sp.]
MSSLKPSLTHATHYHANGRFQLVVEPSSVLDAWLRVNQSLSLLRYIQSFSGSIIYIPVITSCIRL